jgi:predicted permease
VPNALLTSVSNTAMDQFRQDLVSALRNVRKYPVACVVAILSLAGGLGAMTATLTVRNVLFRNPPPLYPDPGQLSRIQVGTPQQPVRPLGSAVPAALFRMWQGGQIGGAVGGSTAARTRDVRGGDQTVQRPVRSVTPQFFSVIGVVPILGRVTSEADAGNAPAVLSYRVWQVLYEGRADIIGQPLWIDNQPYSVVAVMPDRFWFSSMDSPIWTPQALSRLHANEPLDTIVRRDAGVSVASLAARLQPGLDEYGRTLSESDRQYHLRVSGIEGTPVAMGMALVLPYLISACVLLTLLIACANVAILMIAQWTGREQEIAIRSALGASRRRIVHALLTESVLIASCGGALGIVATYALRGLIIRRAGPLVAFFDLTIPWTVLIQGILLTVMTGVIAGLAPALNETRRLQLNPLNALRTSERVRQRWRHALVVFEIAVTMALLVVATMGVDNYRRAINPDFGFLSHRLMTVTVQHLDGIATPQVLDSLRQLPGVASVAASTMSPFASNGVATRVSADAAGSNAFNAQLGLITPEFFETLGVTLRQGRAFTGRDTPQTRTAIVNETLASRLSVPGGRPVGAMIWSDSTSYEIVGVVADYANNSVNVRPGQPRIYFPAPVAASTDLPRVIVLIRAAGDPGPLVEVVRRTIAKAAIGHTVVNANTLDQINRVGSQEMLVGFAPLVPLIVIGMLLTAAGVYGVLAFAITRRSKEFAVRIAVGASAADLVRLVAVQSSRLLVIGIGLGLGLMWGLRQLVRSAGGAGSSFDPQWRAFAVPLLIVVVIGIAATWLPTRRVRRVDPSQLLRSS